MKAKTKELIRDHIQVKVRTTVYLTHDDVSKIDKLAKDITGQNAQVRSFIISKMASFCNANIPSFEAWVKNSGDENVND